MYDWYNACMDVAPLVVLGGEGGHRAAPWRTRRPRMAPVLQWTLFSSWYRPYCSSHSLASSCRPRSTPPPLAR